MDFRGIHDRLRAISAPGLTGVDEPREKDPEIKKDKGRHGDSWVIVDPQSLAGFVDVCRRDESLKFDMLIDLKTMTIVHRQVGVDTARMKTQIKAFFAGR